MGISRAIVGLLLVGMCWTASAQQGAIVVGAERLAAYAGRDASVAEGRVLVSELGCASCHALDSGLGVGSKRGPNLGDAGCRLNPGYLRGWLMAPWAVEAGTTMPDVLSTSPLAKRGDVLGDLVHFLVSKNGPFVVDEADAIDAARAARGETLFHTVGCVACHAQGRSPTARVGGDDAFSEAVVTFDPIRLQSVPLPDFRAKTNFESLSAFLYEPHVVRPSGRMPDMKLSPEEAGDLASYLLSDIRGATAATHSDDAFAVDARKAARGAEAFVSLRCVACHDDGEQEFPAELMVPLLDNEGGCIAEMPETGAPWYVLSDRQRASIGMALGEKNSPGLDDAVATRLAALNCFACHERDGVGGIESGRNPYFTAVIEADLGDEGRIPPPLTGVGAKLTEEGLSQVLLEDGTVRPYMATRMPHFGEAQLDGLPQQLLAVDADPNALDIDVSGLQLHHRNLYGRELMGTEGLSCVSCHNLLGAKSLGIPAIDLATVPGRIQPSWFKKYLLDPSELRPGTRMPTFFEDGKSDITRVLGGNADQQIEALWIYLREIEQTRLPVGMEGNEDFELVPEDRPIVLRTFLEGVGTHAIAVGFPEGTHVAFDAREVRLTLAWKGGFISAESTWADRFSPLAEPLSEELRYGPSAMPIVAVNGTDDVEIEAEYRFRGYRLDDGGVPVFMYTISAGDDAIAVEERVGVSASGIVSRRFTITGNSGTTLLVRGSDAELPVRVEASAESTVVETIWDPKW